MAKQYLTSKRSWHSNIKFISSRRCVISSICNDSSDSILLFHRETETNFDWYCLPYLLIKFFNSIHVCDIFCPDVVRTAVEDVPAVSHDS